MKLTQRNQSAVIGSLDMMQYDGILNDTDYVAIRSKIESNSKLSAKDIQLVIKSLEHKIKINECVLKDEENEEFIKFTKEHIVADRLLIEELKNLGGSDD